MLTHALGSTSLHVLRERLGDIRISADKAVLQWVVRRRESSAGKEDLMARELNHAGSKECGVEASQVVSHG